MNEPDPGLVDRVFCRALALASARRGRFLALACRDDPALGAAVERLLQAEQASRAAFDAGIAENRRRLAAITGDAAAAGAPTREGQRLGPFRLLQRIGAGGMAVVYLAERDDGAFHQRVAIKLLRHNVDAGDDIARFDAERRILSRLRHPNIARLMDGGTTPDGVPYLVTEYVDGYPITEYCATHRLGVEARLDLFAQVADAVHHAHQALVVHRDLKPSNVLVARDGRVALLDFGIAKLVEPNAADGVQPATRTGVRVMTPEYASPEQRSGDAVTTATDVFQLGALLFELLTGVRPLVAADGAPPRASAAVARNPPGGARPPGSSLTLSRRLRGDIDVILQAALQPDPARRPASAAAFASDLRAHLAHRPISARPEGIGASLWRLARRRPLSAVLSGVAVLLLAGWLASLHWLSLELSRERDLAQSEAARAARAYQLLLDIFGRADPLAQGSAGGRGATVWDALDASAASARATLRDDPGTLADILASLARLQRAAGRLDAARGLLLETVALREREAGPQASTTAVVLAELGSVEAAAGRAEVAAPYLARALAIAGTLPASDAADAISVYLDAGHTAVDAGDAGAASAHFRAAERLLRTSPARDPNALVEVLLGQANASTRLGRAQSALAAAGEAVRMAEALYGPQHARLVGPLSALAGAQRALGRNADAASGLRRALAIAQRHYGADEENVLSLRNNLALVLGAAGDRAGEQAELRLLLQARESRFGDRHPIVADGQQNLGVSLAASGDHAGALAALGTARRIYDATLPAASTKRAFPRLKEAQVQLDIGEPAAAEVMAREAGAILRQALPPGHFAIGIADCLLAEARIARGAVEEGRALATRALPGAMRAPAEQAAYADRCRALTATGSATPG